MKKIIIIACFIPFLAVAQKRAMVSAQSKYTNLEYVESIKIYEKLVKRGHGTPEVFEKLANANFDNANYVAANKWFEKLAEVTPSMSPENHFRFASTLKSVGKLQEAENQMKLFVAARPNEARSILYKNKNTAKSVFEFSKVKGLSINSSASDFGAFLKGDTLVFSSARPHSLSNQDSPRTGQPFTSLYQTSKSEKSEYSTPMLFSMGAYSNFNEATPVITNDGKTMYYTQNILVEKSKNKLVNEGYKLYKSSLVNGKWVNEGFISFSQNDSVKMAHPCFSKDGKTLYFASDMPGTKGKSDLFKVAVNEDGSFGPIVPIHKDINTEARETFPFVTSSNMLFFASDGHPGMGGLDLFSLDLNNPNAKVISLGASINSAFDDFGLLVSDDLSQAFFTSNRAGGKGDDDIYSVVVREIPLTIEQKQDAIEKVVVSGTIKDNALNELLPNVNVVLVDATDKEIARTKTDEKGKYTFTNVLPNTNYFVNVNKFDKLVQKIPVTVASSNVSSEVAVSKNLVVPKVDITKAPTNVGVDVALALKIDQIYFDTNKYDIRPDAKLDLDLLVAYLKLNATVKIEIGSHTDSRDTKEYNMILSQKRAQSTLNYIVSEGIDATRLIAVGYGESKLVNKCTDGAKCSEAQHQQNRRSTFIIK